MLRFPLIFIIFRQRLWILHENIQTFLRRNHNLWKEIMRHKSEAFVNDYYSRFNFAFEHIFIAGKTLQSMDDNKLTVWIVEEVVGEVDRQVEDAHLPQHSRELLARVLDLEGLTDLLKRDSNY